MRIVMLENSGQVYTSQVYLVLGDASRLEDVNTLVDVGQDEAILASVERGPPAAMPPGTRATSARLSKASTKCWMPSCCPSAKAIAFWR